MCLFRVKIDEDKVINIIIYISKALFPFGINIINQKFKLNKHIDNVSQVLSIY